MKRAAGFLVTAVLAAAAVAAQTTSPAPPPSDRSTYPSSSAPSTPSSGSYNSSSSSTGKTHEQAMKDCMAQEQANNPNMSKADMKKACKEQMHSSSSSNPHQ